jgi:hypothetical protein
MVEILSPINARSYRTVPRMTLLRTVPTRTRTQEQITPCTPARMAEAVLLPSRRLEKGRSSERPQGEIST